MSVVQQADISPGRRWRRWPYLAVALVAALGAAGAFLLWGPIGFGNGPLAVQMADSEGWADVGEAPAAIILPLYNSGGRPAVIDSVDLVGGTRYPGPQLLGLQAMSDAICGGAWPARANGPAFAMIGCGGRDQGPLIGRSIDPTNQPYSRGFPAAAFAAAPRPGMCWVMTKITVRYHVGFRHYTATDPFDLAVCGKGASAQVSAAMNAGASG